MRLYTLVLTSIASASLVACGGGGSSATLSGGTPSPLINVPYYTPVRVGTAVISDVVTTESAVAYSFNADLTNSGSDNVIVAGRSLDAARADSKLSIYGWSNGALVDQTSQWLSGTDNVIGGTEPDVEIGDFNGDGLIDLYIAPSTDSDVSRGDPGVVLINNGTSFSRTDINLGSVWAHDSVVYDFDGDGKSDIFNTEFGIGATLAISNGDGTFNIATNTSSAFAGASSVAAADFLGNGTTSVIITDSSTNDQESTKLLSYAVSGTTLTMATESILPVPIFDRTEWDNGSSVVSSHVIRTLAFDFDDSGSSDAVLITAVNSNASLLNSASSAVQFLQNDGVGNFTDVTDTTLVDWDYSIAASYNPKLIDINGDGLTDIFLGAQTWDNTQSNTVALMHTSDHKFVTSYANVFTAVQNQTFDMESLINAGVSAGGSTNIIKGPDNTLYLVTLLNMTENGTQSKAVYLSKIGEQVASAQSTASAISASWPYLSDGTVNEILATTSTVVFGLNELNLDKIFSPIGSLGVSVNGVKQTFSGYLSGVNLEGVKPLLFDDYNRSFAVNVPTVSNNNTWAAGPDNLDQETRSSVNLQYADIGGIKLGLDDATQSFTAGLGVKVGKYSQLNLQTTNLTYNPFLSMSGSWGEINSSSTVETSFITKQNGWIGKAGLMHTVSNITPGIVTKVSSINSVWAEGGYDFGNTKLFAGLFPKVIGGSVSLNMPASIDTYGKISYNNVEAKVTNPTTGYVRLSHSKKVTKQSNFTFNAMITSTGQTKAYGEFKVQF